MVAFLFILFGTLLVFALTKFRPEQEADARIEREGVPDGRAPGSDGLHPVDSVAVLRKRLLQSQWETARDRQCISRPVRGSLAVKPIRKRVRKGKPSLCERRFSLVFPVDYSFLWWYNEARKQGESHAPNADAERVA